MLRHKGLKLIAILEGTKGLLALIVSLGIHSLAGENIQKLVETLFLHLHLNPASHWPSVLIDTASNLNDSNFIAIAVVALLYSIIRFIEAYGLWKEYYWTKWFALISGGIYIPFELYELVVKTNILSTTILLLNIVVVGYLFHVMKKNTNIE